MKTVFVLIVLFNLLVFSTSAQTITPAESKIVASNFMAERLQIPISSISITNTFNIDKEGMLVYRVHNLNKGGFVLVSATKSVRPVLAYTLSGIYSNDDQAPAFTAWADQYASQIAFALENDADATPETSVLWDKYLDDDYEPANENVKSVEPMLISTWDQGQFYNLMCPNDPGGPAGHCYTGCVATAMGQLCYYFRWPQTGVGSYTYQHPVYGTMTANFGETIYDWNAMVNSLNGPNMAVATLLNHLGVSVDMDYGPDGSGMWNHKAAYSLRTYFKYSPETEYLFRDSTNLDWDSTIVAHLNQGIPMYYAGWSVPNVNGHAFIVDGYQTEEYFHFNFGWGGSYDGYFYLDELTPGGSNFNLAQELVIHCFPDTANYAYPPYCAGTDTLHSLSGTIDDGSFASYNYLNGTSCSWLVDPQNEFDSVNYIKLNFDRLETEPGADKVVIYDGPDSTAPILGEFSGDSIPAQFQTSGNMVFITFETNNSVNDAGWFLSYQSVSPVWCSGLTTLTEPEGFVSDGSGTFNYRNSSACMWKIEPPFGHDLTLFFNSFDTEQDKDVVKIYDAESSTLLAEYSGYYEEGNMPAPVTSESGKMLVAFSSDPVNNHAGWEAAYSVGNVGFMENENTGLHIFPNPADHLIYIYAAKNTGCEINISVVSVTGKAVINQTFDDFRNPATIDIGHLPAGLYFAKLTCKTETFVEKLIIK